LLLGSPWLEAKGADLTRLSIRHDEAPLSRNTPSRAELRLGSGKEAWKFRRFYGQPRSQKLHLKFGKLFNHSLLY
jgi:hypothetical protein